MRRLAAAVVACLVGATDPALAAERRMPWAEFDPDVASALHAFRQTNHWIAEAMAVNMDGDRQGLDSEFGLPFNFDATRHLLYIVTDLNRDGKPEVFLLFVWPTVRGNQQAHGVIMQRYGDGWRIACEFSDWGEGAANGIRFSGRRSFGWRNFRTSDEPFTWRQVPDAPSAMQCVASGNSRGRPPRMHASPPATR